MRAISLAAQREVPGSLAGLEARLPARTAARRRPGEIFRQPDLARTLRSMVEAEKKALAAGASRAKAIDAVRDYFYRGDIAHRIDAFSKQNGGLLRYEDMAASTWSRKRRSPPPSTATRSTSPASGARGRP